MKIFLSKKFYQTHDALLSISEQKYIDSENRQKSHPRYFFKDYLTMKNEFKDLSFAIENSLLIAKKCTFILDEKPTNLPKIFSNKNKENELLKLKSETGLSDRLSVINLNDSEKSQYFERLNYELNIIMNMGYSSYFQSEYGGQSNNIPVGPGRGSGAGSLVAWALQITNLDPLRFGLLFERFLNPDRVSLLILM